MASLGLGWRHAMLPEISISSYDKSAKKIEIRRDSNPVSLVTMRALYPLDHGNPLKYDIVRYWTFPKVSEIRTRIDFRHSITVWFYVYSSNFRHCPKLNKKFSFQTHFWSECVWNLNILLGNLNTFDGISYTFCVWKHTKALNSVKLEFQAFSYSKNIFMYYNK